MRLQGSCHCGVVSFSLECAHPVPYQRCYCSICRKTGGAGGYMINIGGQADGFEVEGRENVSVYQATLRRGGETIESPHERHFCARCGSHLWAWNPRWPELVHPVASAIDTPLPTPPQHVHMMLESKANWVEIEGKKGDARFDGYPDESLADWHDQRGLTAD